MEVILAGDIIGSQKNKPDDFLSVIEPILKEHCKDGMYQIYRGDSFQGWIKTPELGLSICLKIKAALKSKGSLDVRIAIGMGEVNLIDNNIALSTGSALTRSGELLDSLKEVDQNLMVQSNHHLDYYMNTALKMALLYMDQWTQNGAAVIHQTIKNPDATQTQLGEILGIKQATASRRLERAYWNETQDIIELFKQYYKDISHAPTH
ncbi:MAG: MarR family transcriptional regulator [Nonlabens sp.]|uniref:MarR family transcriptional regulator n=1 Tax=Nonlabens sp. TaxID=1888209 RepID=UPI003EF7DB9A